MENTNTNLSILDNMHHRWLLICKVTVTTSVEINGKTRSDFMFDTERMTGWISVHHLHGASFMVTYEWGPLLNGDWLRQRHGPVRLISGQVLQAARVCLFLPILSREEERVGMLLCEHMVSLLEWNTILPAALPPQKPA